MFNKNQLTLLSSLCFISHLGFSVAYSADRLPREEFKQLIARLILLTPSELRGLATQIKKIEPGVSEIPFVFNSSMSQALSKLNVSTPPETQEVDESFAQEVRLIAQAFARLAEAMEVPAGDYAERQLQAWDKIRQNVGPLSPLMQAHLDRAREELIAQGGVLFKQDEIQTIAYGLATQLNDLLASAPADKGLKILALLSLSVSLRAKICEELLTQ